MEQNLALIGALPQTGLRQVRIHYLMNLISVDTDSLDSDQIRYNFTDLDQLLIRLKELRLKPGFELMGNPSKLFNDFENRTQLYEWKSLVKQMVTRYQQLLGRDYLRQWYFESWNEPSIEFKNHFRDGIKVTTQGFLNYYDACSQAIKEVDPELRFGGPGDHWPADISKGPFVIDLLRHYINGTNYFTRNKSDIKMNFISLHEKGDHGHSEHIDRLEDKALDDIRDSFPAIADMPFVENEGDPEVSEEISVDNTYIEWSVRPVGI